MAGRWTPDEDALLKQTVETLGTADWRRIAQTLTDRTGGAWRSSLSVRGWARKWKLIGSEIRWSGMGDVVAAAGRAGGGG